MLQVEPEEDEDVLRLLREVVLQMDEPDEQELEAVERAAEVEVRGVGFEVPAVVDPLRRIQGQLRRDQLRDNMPQGRQRH